MDFQNCKRAKYCSFMVLFSDEEIQREACEFCKRIITFKKDEKGRIWDKNKYKREHIRDFCQPFGYTKQVFLEVYGPEKMKEFDEFCLKKAESKKKQEDLAKEFKDYVRQGDTSYFT